MIFDLPTFYIRIVWTWTWTKRIFKSASTEPPLPIYQNTETNKQTSNKWNEKQTISKSQYRNINCSAKCV